MKIIISGSRHFQDYDLMHEVLSVLPAKTLIVHGGAPGADSIAGIIAKELGFEVKVFHADWEKFGKKAGPWRNQQMVDGGADFCFAFPLADSIGTWDCCRRANAAGIKTEVFERLEDGVMRRKYNER